MKILNMLTSINPLHGGGVCEATYNLSKALNKFDDVDMEILSLDLDVNDALRKKWSFLNIKLFKSLNLFNYGYSNETKPYILESNADILHNNGVWEYNSHICLYWKKNKNKPYIITPHGMLDKWALSNNSWKKKIVYNVIERKYFEKAKCIHALNKEEEKSIRELGLKNPICIIPNGIDLPITNEQKLPTIWNKKRIRDKKILLFLGRLHHKKGLENLIQAWKKISDSGYANDWVIMIAGQSRDQYESKLAELTETNKLKDSVFLLGSVINDDKKSVLQNADAFILPSFSEGLPVAVLEAWSYKLPVLMTKECNLPNGFKYNCAIEIEPNIDSIADGIKKLISLSPEARNEMGKNGFDFVSKQYTWGKIANDFRLVYKWLLGKTKKPDCVELYDEG